jgi:hypothetical protein
VTPDKRIVWEYMNAPGEGPGGLVQVYRAYRIPYGWLPQVPVPQQVALPRPDQRTFRVPGSLR